MAMKAKVYTDANGNITVHIEGGLNYENCLPFRKELDTILVANPYSTITLDMNGLDFVCSSGICHFVETIKILHNKKYKIKLLNVKKEFLRVFKLYNFEVGEETEVLEELANEFENSDTESLSPKFANRRNTFQN